MAKLPPPKLRLVPSGNKLSEVAATVNTLFVLVCGVIASIEEFNPGTKRQMAMTLQHFVSAFRLTPEQTAAYKEASRILTEE
jgi:hypothetical protein